MSTPVTTPVTLSELTAEKIAEYSASMKNSLTPPGHMQKDKANAYMAKIVQLFGKERGRSAIGGSGLGLRA